ncbi:MAG: PHP domain-containing protein [Clostridia bacterium]|nr:PHP domain-containing protein [Clostridia bacterium]
MTPDLHMHTTSSDGTLSPRELVAMAARQGVTIMAITDHDTFDGVDALQGTETAIPVLTGTELSLRDMRGLHLLGYGMGAAAELRQAVADLAARRFTRAKRMVDKLQTLGYPLDYDAIRAECKGTVGRMHIARTMVSAGYVSDIREAFGRFLGDDGPAYVAGERLSMAEALPLMRRNGFVPVLAHPAELGKDDVTLRALLGTWQNQGLMGVEVYHPSQSGRGFSALDAMVRRMGMLVTGGSDFHHVNDSHHGQPGCTAAFWRQAQADTDALVTAMRLAVINE